MEIIEHEENKKNKKGIGTMGSSCALIQFNEEFAFFRFAMCVCVIRGKASVLSFSYHNQVVSDANFEVLFQ